MGNNHVNGSNPYQMSTSEARKEIDDWVEHGGKVRIDGPHSGNNSVHAHLYEGNVQSTDILIQIHPDEDSPNSEDSPDNNLKESSEEKES